MHQRENPAPAEVRQGRFALEADELPIRRNGGKRWNRLSPRFEIEPDCVLPELAQ